MRWTRGSALRLPELLVPKETSNIVLQEGTLKTMLKKKLLQKSGLFCITCRC